MSCELLQGISKDCSSNVGGLRLVYFIRKNDINSVTIVGNEITQISVNLPFRKYHAPKNSAGYTIDFNIDDFGVQEYTHSLNFRINKRNVNKHSELLALAQGNQDLVALVQDANGLFWLLGYPYGLNLSQNTGGSGTNKGEGSSYQLAMTGIAPTMEYLVLEAAIQGLNLES